MLDLIQPIYSPCYGKVENILVNESSHIYEWEKLFLIREKNGSIKEIRVGVSGLVTTLNVKENQNVTPNTVLAKIKEDLFITGSD
jgi:biotin carboxyl carrier protein